MKADNLARMRAHGLPVPEFAVFRRNDAIRLDFSGAERFAVRSTFDAEDSAAHSFAGQFDTLLNVARADVPKAVEQVRKLVESDCDGNCALCGAVCETRDTDPVADAEKKGGEQA